MHAVQVPSEPFKSSEAVAERELRDFSYLVAHGLASEFRYVAEFSRLLADEAGESPTGAHVRAIFQSAVRCQRMLDAVLVFSSVQTHELARRVWPGRAVVERAIVELGEEVAGRATIIEVDVAGDVFGDARLLILAVKLALMNALEAARDGVDLVVRIQGRNDRSGNWILEIADNGEGLDREYREKAFTMFWRLDPETPGVGAGLPTLRRIVRRHGGEASFLDSVEGARLQIVVPRVEAPQ
jgi:signal transduction histidine kinase